MNKPLAPKKKPQPRFDPNRIVPGSAVALKISGGRDLPSERARERMHNAPKPAPFAKYVAPKPTKPADPGFRPVNPGPRMPASSAVAKAAAKAAKAAKAQAKK
jgi:hypothetical protein